MARKRKQPEKSNTTTKIQDLLDKGYWVALPVDDVPSNFTMRVEYTPEFYLKELVKIHTRVLDPNSSEGVLKYKPNLEALEFTLKGMVDICDDVPDLKKAAAEILDDGREMIEWFSDHQIPEGDIDFSVGHWEKYIDPYEDSLECHRGEPLEEEDYKNGTFPFSIQVVLLRKRSNK